MICVEWFSTKSKTYYVNMFINSTEKCAKCLKFVQQETLMFHPDLNLSYAGGGFGLKITIDFQRSTTQCKNNFPTSILILTFTILNNIKFV